VSGHVVPISHSGTFSTPPGVFSYWVIPSFDSRTWSLFTLRPSVWSHIPPFGNRSVETLFHFSRFVVVPCAATVSLIFGELLVGGSSRTPAKTCHPSSLGLSILIV